MKKHLWLATALLLAALAFSAAYAQDAQTPAALCAAAVPAPEPATRTFTEPEQVLEPGVDYRAILCTEAGPIYVDLYQDLTPATVNSFVFLAQQGYYNNTTFHRVLQNFMAQGGDPTGTGSGGPGYQFGDEFVGFLTFDVPGWLAMANAGPGTNGSQFFITTVPTPHLDFGHTIFGAVLEGQDNVASIRLRDPATATEPGTALQTVIIITDPAAVVTTYTQPEPATLDDVIAAFKTIATIITPEMNETIKQETASQTTDDVIATAPESERQTYADFLARYGHEYRAANTITNAACDLNNIDFASMRYTLDSFASANDAAAALQDPYMSVYPTALGFEPQVTPFLAYPLFTRSDTACDQDMTHALTYWQRGHFIATVEILIPTSSETGAFLDRILAEFVGLRIYEPLLSSVLRREAR